MQRIEDRRTKPIAEQLLDLMGLGRHSHVADTKLAGIRIVQTFKVLPKIQVCFGIY